MIVSFFFLRAKDKGGNGPSIILCIQQITSREFYSCLGTPCLPVGHSSSRDMSSEAA